MKELDFIYKRKSVRKFTDEKVHREELMEIIKAATHAPSGKNQQNWHFVILNNKEKIQEIAKLVEDKTHQLVKTADDEIAKDLMKFLRYHTLFKDAPTLILIFAGPYKLSAYNALISAGKVEEADRLLETSTAIQNVAAAMENLQLAAAALGYGTCWMTGPNFAAKEIEGFLNFSKDGYHLAAMTPLGRPLDQEIISPQRKDINEVITIID
ncbi:nitroreductase family protein [Alkaliphilus serpentinus]|uniref:Nitroreductase family protein n=1 Tax=Alkaliphilus serpentinus TaxID=1482731 RepID=A0A833HMI5_9FIRM|nr:nitroreductase family protein [Alkaliphilus serpentinus]KAB3527689.1 nitroreductase family protein [Alkaliphilus serpentinus]